MWLVGNMISLKEKNNKLEPKKMNPDRDWFYGLLVFFVFLISILLVAGINLWKIKEGNFFKTGVPSEVTSDPLNKELLEKVVSSFDERQAQLENLLSSPPETIDPSL